MKYLIIIILVLAVILLIGCEKAPQSPEKAQPKPVESGDKEIIAAIKFAYSLEQRLWESEEKINEKQDVIILFKQGFSEEMARKYADYVWIEENGKRGSRYRMLRAGEPVLILPDSIEVEDKGEEKATVFLRYNENPEGPLTWEAHTDIVSLKKENGVWKIYDIKTKGI